jgi:acyl carrier protein
MNEASTATLQEIFRAVFDLPAGADVTGLRQGDSEKWDSLAHVSLVTGIESEFGLNLDTSDQLEMVSYSAIREMLDRRGV